MRSPKSPAAKNFLLITALLSLSFLAQAQSSSATVGSTDAAEAGATTSSLTPATEAGSTQGSVKKVLGQKQFEESHEITDAQLKVDTGSLSRWSVKSNLSYYGPMLGDLGAKDQPNPDGTRGTYETALSGTVGIRYRLDSNTTISAGTGLKAIHPLNGWDRTDVSTPFMSYDISGRWHGIQWRSSPGFSIVTIPTYTQAGEVYSLSYDWSSVYDLGASRWAIGLDGNVSYYGYNRDWEPKDGKDSRGSISLYPTLKYNFTDRWQFNTSTTLGWLSPYYKTDNSILYNRTVSQRLGLGYGYSREIYIYPYVNVLPTRTSWDTTTLNLSTSFSLL